MRYILGAVAIVVVLVLCQRSDSPTVVAQAPSPPQAPRVEDSEFGIAGTVVDVKLVPHACPAGVCTGNCNCANQDQCGAGKCPPKAPPLPSLYAQAFSAASRGTPTTVTVGFHEVPDIAPGTWLEPGLWRLSFEGGRVVGRHTILLASPTWSQLPILPASGTWSLRKVCHGDHCTMERVWVPATK